ncbi:MAG TPA: TetR/AcrR family transcriptional regulator [Pseudonocardiaceae bacterium]|jgi:AcrR family transcriptional regulator|nr:TetR/AcrR family transcriptional regulator [Pseudonocardiaceae bacterium]
MSISGRKERERAERHELIISTARELAEAEGWDAVTTRRLAERIEYSQPVLYSHFAGKDAIVSAVAVQGFAELATALAAARASAGTPEQAVAAVAGAYTAFGAANPALYDAMFTLTTDLPFATAAAPAPLRAAFAEIADALAPLAGERDPGLYAEVGWGAMHGMVTLTRAGRLPADQREQRLALLVGQLVARPGHI